MQILKAKFYMIVKSTNNNHNYKSGLDMLKCENFADSNKNNDINLDK